MKRRIYTIQPAKGQPGVWELLGHIISMTRTNKANLVAVARAIARAHTPSQLRIKGRDGRIQTEATYGADPRRYVG